MDSLGIYISVPFCKAKCTFCNFASDVFAANRMDRYVDQVCLEVSEAKSKAVLIGAKLPDTIDSIYFGGGTPSLLDAALVRRIFAQLKSEFADVPEAEITLECAPGQLSNATLGELLRQGMNRISFGVQSFVDAESAAVGRLHTRQQCLEEIARARAAGLNDINIDLIAGLPLQTGASFRYSVEEAIATGATHVSVYMLEVDEESRLGREVLGRGSRYSAEALPSEDETADFYQMACSLLNADGVQQYEISNFARSGYRSRHNLKYWRRHPYIGFGLDAHSMLKSATGAVRFANTDDLEDYLRDPSNPFALAPIPPHSEVVGPDAAFEESLFLGLRLNEGVALDQLRQVHGALLLDDALSALRELGQEGLVQLDEDRVRLTDRGRLLSNEVFSRILIATPA